jgi:hypothetical protein
MEWRYDVVEAFPFIPSSNQGRHNVQIAMTCHFSAARTVMRVVSYPARPSMQGQHDVLSILSTLHVPRKVSRTASITTNGNSAGK